MGKNDFYKAMLFENPAHLPIGGGILPSAWMKYGDSLREITRRYPEVFAAYQDQNARYEAAQGTYIEGEHVDVWGCVWKNVHAGREAMVKGHPLPNREDIRTLKMPVKDAGFPHGFMYLRLADLRGFEECMMDFAEEPPELRQLIDIVLAYNMRQAQIKLAAMKGKGEIVFFGDDLGMQKGLAIGAAKWRKYLKPCYKKIYDVFKKAGHYVYMHTDGEIHEIIPDLIECGVDIINPQFRANGPANLARVCKGKVCVDLDLDRQMMPFCAPEDIDRHVKEAVEALGSPNGGLMLKAEIDDGVPLENVEALAEALMKYRGYFSR